MKISLICIGKTDTSYLKTGIAEYAQRISRYLAFEITEIPELKNVSSFSSAQIREKEGDLLLKKWPQGATIVLLDEHGKEGGSTEFASFLQGKMNQGTKHLVFIVGGAYGFSEEVHKKSDHLLSLSKMTFSHQMVRLFFTEQLYRAFTILRNEPYHNE
jgi:23S rRNA (pseudouridine1915-N3)-methyltransferase